MTFRTMADWKFDEARERLAAIEGQIRYHQGNEPDLNDANWRPWSLRLVELLDRKARAMSEVTHHLRGYARDVQ